MRWLVLVLALVGCGSDDGGDSASAPFAPVIKNVALLTMNCTDIDCPVVGAVALENEVYDEDAFAVVWTWTIGLVPPPCVATNTTEMDDDRVFSLPRQGFVVIVSARVCIMNRLTGEFDEGVPVTVVTPAS
jgi:hypothetical protein